VIVKESVSTITSKGQVTIPVEVRKYLGLSAGDRISFVIDRSGNVVLRVPKYPTVASLAGAAGKLDHSMEMEKMLEIARENAVEDEYRTSR